MSRGVYVGTVFHLDGFLQTRHQPPEFSLDIVLGNRPGTVEYGVERKSVLEIVLLEVRRLILELLERVCSTFFKTKLAITNQASRAMPIILWLVGYRLIK